MYSQKKLLLKILHFRSLCKQELQRLVDKGILRWLEKVEVTEWLSGASFVVKPSRGLQLVTDLVHLNRVVQRPTHPFQLVNGILSSIELGSKYFVTLNALGGLFANCSSPRKPKASSQSGGMTYLRAPMGLMSSGDVFCFCTDQALAGITGVHKLV